MDHGIATQRAQMVAESCATRRIDRFEIRTDLVARGLDVRECEIAVEVVVAAFGWAVLRRMGVRGFPSVFRIHQPDGEVVVLNVGDAHLFTAALGIAVAVFEDGYRPGLDKEGVSAIVAASAEVGAVSQALNDDPSSDLSKANLQTAFYGFEVRDFLVGAGYPTGISPTAD